jgi:hypothetical protein
MVRNLTMIFGLSLAVAAFGCSDDDGNKGGSGGSTGGTGGVASLPVAPACDNAEDSAKIAAGEPSNTLSIECGTKDNLGADKGTLCSPDNSGMIDCYLNGADGAGGTDGTTLSEECTSCYADLNCCTGVKCSVLADPPSVPPGNCAGPPTTGSDCEACVARECFPAFSACGETGGGGSGGGSGGSGGGSGGSGGSGASGGSGGVG